MAENTRHPKIFISYTWSSEEHKDWVLELASRLKTDGVDVLLDRWKLDIGDITNKYMESIVSDKDIDFVVIVSDSMYSKKADENKGGTGIEAQIISNELYNKTKDTRFIPILRERDDKGNVFLPIFLQGRMYIDFSDNGKYEESYERLLRKIYHKPSLKEPPIGEMPKFLQDDEALSSLINFHAQDFGHQIEKSPQRTNQLLKDYIEKLELEFPNYAPIIENRNDFGRAIVKSISDFKVVRDNYISVISTLFQSGNDFDIDILIDFFARLPQYYRPIDKTVMSWNPNVYEGFKYISRELFLYTVALCVKFDKYQELSDLYYSHYEFIYNAIDKMESDYTGLGFNIDIFDDYINNRDSKNYVSCMGTLMYQNVNSEVGIKRLAEADVLCAYVAQMSDRYWFPHLRVYGDIYKGYVPHIDIIDKLSSARYFEKVKCIFDVNTSQEFKDKLDKLEKRYVHVNLSDGQGRVMPFIFLNIKSNQVAIYR